VWPLAATVLAIAVALSSWLLLRPKVEDRVYRIGWQEDPPNMFTSAGGKPEGFGPDLVSAAARRRGIRLKWVYCPGSSAEALRTGQIDLWPLLTVLPERKAFVHYSTSYFRNYLAYVVRGDSPFTEPGELQGKRVGFYDLPINHQLLHRWLPGGVPVPHRSMRQGLSDLRKGAIDVLLVDELKLVAELMSGVDTTGMGLRMIHANLPPAEMAVAGTHAAAAAVDALGAEIEEMSQQGEASRLVLIRGVTAHREVDDMTLLIQARLQVRRMALALIAAASFAVAGLLLAIGYRRQRDSARAMDEARRQADRELRLMADNLSEMVLAFDMDRRVIYANPALERLTGYSVAELRAAGFIDWVHPEDQARMRARWESLYAGEEGTAESYRLIRKDGETRWMRASWGPIRDEAGAQIGVRGSEEDITALTEAQAEMRRLAQAVSQTTDAVIVTDRQGTIGYVNPAFERATGYSREEAIGKQPSLLKSGVHGQEFYASLWKTLLAGQPWTGRIVNRRKDQSLYTEQCTISPVLDEKGEVRHFLAVKKDITQELALEEQVRHAQKMESIGTLAGGVAHDFNNLLTVISGNAQLALRALPETHPAAERITRALVAGERAADLTRQLLAFSRKQAVQPELLDLNAAIGEMEPVLSSLMGDTGLLRLTLCHSTPTVMMDRTQLQQVVMNLAVNGRDAMAGQGTLTIRTASEDGCSVLEVIDTGHGMGETVRQQIFEPFFSTKPAGSGTGLGLAVVYGIVTQSGGTITVESQVGEGSCFRILLPAVEGVAKEQQRQPADAPRTGSEAVLLVEDQPEVRHFVGEVLRLAGYRVTTAEDGEEALEAALSDGDLDVLLTDLSMPGMNGVELATRIRDSHPRIAVLCMSGFEGAEPAGEWPVLSKPFTPEALLAAIRKVRQSA
jgi:PAS domain S-box-containing protein